MKLVINSRNDMLGLDGALCNMLETRTKVDDARKAQRNIFAIADLRHPLRWINRNSTLQHIENARCLAIAQPMNLGDVVACLPLAGILKATWPHMKICFIGGPYVRPLTDCCEHIDQFLEADAVLAEPNLISKLGVDIFLNPFPHKGLAVAAYRAGVPIRVGNLRRPKIWRYCNRFVMYSRRDYSRHEIELNLENLGGLGLPTRYPISEIPGYFGLSRLPELEPELNRLLDPRKFNIIFHPKSNKNGREWPARHYAGLARMLPHDRFQILITGLAHEREDLLAEAPEIFSSPIVIDLCGRLSLTQFIALIGKADGLLASGTGPLHVAAAMHKHALGIFPPRAGIDPAHWAPVGRKGEFLCLPDRCLPGGDRCPREFTSGYCACTDAIKPEQVMARILGWVH